MRREQPSAYLIVIVICYSRDKIQQPSGNIAAACLQVEQHGAAALQQVHDIFRLFELIRRADHDPGPYISINSGVHLSILRGMWSPGMGNSVWILKKSMPQIIPKGHNATSALLF